MTYTIIRILLLAFVQNISFSIVSRSRNRDNKKYHIIASLFSNSIWFLTFRELILGEMNYILFIPYVIGTIIGSTFGMSISMKIEKYLGASSDSHLNKKTQ
jgi:predicted lysophospholipase L1 biosynthesis ABC-type transport system permease subunit